MCGARSRVKRLQLLKALSSSFHLATSPSLSHSLAHSRTLDDVLSSVSPHVCIMWGRFYLFAWLSSALFIIAKRPVVRTALDPLQYFTSFFFFSLRKLRKSPSPSSKVLWRCDAQRNKFYLYFLFHNYFCSAFFLNEHSALDNHLKMKFASFIQNASGEWGGAYKIKRLPRDAKTSWSPSRRRLWKDNAAKRNQLLKSSFRFCTLLFSTRHFCSLSLLFLHAPLRFPLHLGWISQ